MSVRAVRIGEDRRLQPAELEERSLQPHEARVAVAFCGICGSDLHLRPSEAVPVGSVMGHELSGTVTEVGPAVKGFAVGDRVAVFPFAPCGECSSCARGDDHVCQQAAVTGLGLGVNPGGYAESVVLDGSMLVSIPDELSFEHGALVEPLAVALHGIEVGEAQPGDRCVVIGAGPIGVMTALGLRALGIDDVLMIKEAQVRASFAYRHEEFEEAVRLLAAGKAPADLLITGTAPLEAAQSMFDRLDDPATEDIKILLDPNAG